jgi:rfaE bifunctional protein kinase chain/domain
LSFAELLDRFGSLRALVIGDLMLDEYIFGKATRISPEAPVMVVRQQSTSHVPGGAANVARNIRALGAVCHTVGVIGIDAAGEALQQSLVESGEVSLVRDPTRSTTRKTRVLADAAHQVLRIDHEEDGPISEATQEQLLVATSHAVASCDVVIMSDYLKGVLTPQVVTGILSAARKNNIPVVVNPKPRSLPQYAGATLVSLNRAEASEALGLWKTLASEEALEAAEQLREQAQVGAVLLTMGEGGMAAVGERQYRIQAPRVEVYDTAGAGDTVIATVALGLAVAGFQEEVFALAAQTAASVVRKVGVATPSEEDLAEIGSTAEEGRG